MAPRLSSVLLFIFIFPSVFVINTTETAQMKLNREIYEKEVAKDPNIVYGVETYYERKKAPLPTTPPAAAVPTPPPFVDFGENDVYQMGPNHDWLRMSKMAGILILSFYCSLHDVFFVTAFFTEKTLRRPGNIYLASTGAADLVISLGVLPLLAIMQVKGDWFYRATCEFIYMMIMLSNYIMSMFYFLAGVNFLFRFTSPEAHRFNPLSRLRGDVVVCVVVAAGIALAMLDVIAKLNYDFCHRQYSGNHTYRATMAFLFFICPFGFGFTAMFIGTKKLYESGGAYRRVNWRRTTMFEAEYGLAGIFCATYILYGVAWFPHFMFTIIDYAATDIVFGYTAFMGTVRLPFTCLIYSFCNVTFRDVYRNFYRYLCCRTLLPPRAVRRRQRRRARVLAYYQAELAQGVLRGAGAVPGAGVAPRVARGLARGAAQAFSPQQAPDFTLDDDIETYSI